MNLSKFFGRIRFGFSTCFRSIMSYRSLMIFRNRLSVIGSFFGSVSIVFFLPFIDYL